MSFFIFFIFYHKKYESAKLTAFDFFFPQRPLPIARSVSLLKGCGKEVRVSLSLRGLSRRFGASSSVLSIIASSQTLDVS